MQAPDWDTSKIEAMTREQLEHKLVLCVNHLMEGVKVVEGAQKSIKWLGDTVVLLSGQLSELHPELKEATDELAKRAMKMMGTK